jgi:hypothetical protein
LSKWQDLYRRFSRLRRQWAVHEDPRVDRQLFSAAVLSTRSEADVKSEFASFRVALPPLWDEAREVNRLLDIAPSGRFPDDPCEDVYQAALTMMPHGVWTESPTHDQLYRGQRDARWAVIPSMFRVADQGRREIIARVRGLAAELASQRPDLSSEQALALIQHYSAELGTPTWLLDLTWDPAVALLFASLRGVNGDTGIVTMLVRREWEEFSASGRNRLGKIRVIEVPDVLRIERQRALFLDTAHPDLFEQYVANSVWFRQVDGLVFEDPDADWQVTRESCFPDADPTLELVRKLSACAAEQGGPELSPPSDASRSLDADDYLAIVLSWCEEEGVELGPPYRAVLAAVCRVYSELQAERADVDITVRSLHRLREAMDLVVGYQSGGRAIDVEKALQWTRSRARTDTERALLDRLIAEASEVSVLDKALEVLDLVPPRLGRLIVIGARDAAAERVDGDINDALFDPRYRDRFRVFNLRGAPDDRAIAALAVEIGHPVRLLLVDSETSPGWLARLVRAVLDGADRVEFAHGWVPLPPERSVVIVYYGATSLADLPPPFAEVPIMQFV